jgi:hypothetical protein
MTKIILKLEDYLAYSTMYVTFIPPILALKLQIRIHKMFPRLFSDRPSNQSYD